MPTPRQQYIKEIDRLIRRFDRLDHSTVRRMIELLQQLRKDLAAVIVNAQSFEGRHLLEIRNGIEQAITQFEAQAHAAIRTSINDAFLVGGDAVTLPLAGAGIIPLSTPINREMLNTLLDFSAVLIRNISGDMRGRIDAQLRLSALGGRSPFQTMQAITDILGVKARDGVWGTLRRPEVVRGVAARAEAITRTEMTRIFSISHQAQAEQVNREFNLGLLKRWIATGDSRTRRTHLQAHRRTAREPIPVNQPFQVGRDKLMFPGDPRGSAEETINCRCTPLTVVPEIGVVPSPLDARIEQQIERRNESYTQSRYA